MVSGRCCLLPISETAVKNHLRRLEVFNSDVFPNLLSDLSSFLDLFF